LRLKILKKLRTASLNSEFAGSYKKCSYYKTSYANSQRQENWTLSLWFRVRLLLAVPSVLTKSEFFYCLVNPKLYAHNFLKGMFISQEYSRNIFKVDQPT